MITTFRNLACKRGAGKKAPSVSFEAKKPKKLNPKEMVPVSTLA
jgi:hypothetical protein